MFRIPHVRRAAWVAMAAAVAGLMVSVGYLSVRIGQQSTREEAQPADVILVLGAAEYRGRPSQVFRARLDHALETQAALREPVPPPKSELDYIHYYCGNTEVPGDLKEREPIRVTLYKSVAALVRAYANISDAGSSDADHPGDIVLNTNSTTVQLTVTNSSLTDSGGYGIFVPCGYLSTVPAATTNTFTGNVTGDIGPGPAGTGC